MIRSFTKRDWALALLLLFALLLGSSRVVYAAPPSQESEEGSLRIVNESEQTICLVHISPVTSDQWGEDWLGEEETIPPGESRVFLVTRGDYDVLLADCNGNKLLDQRGVTVSDHHEVRCAPEPDKVLLDQAIANLNSAAYAEALCFFQELLDSYPDSSHAAAALYGIAVCGFELGDLDKAEQALETLVNNHPESTYAAQVWEDSQNRESPSAANLTEANAVCQTLHASGVDLHSQGRHTEARQTLEKALTCYREGSDHRGEGKVLNNLGAVCEALWEYEDAIRCFEQAIKIARETGDRTAMGVRLFNLGNAHSGFGQYATAIECYEGALTIAREAGERQDQSAALSNMGIAYTSIGQYASAIECYEQSLAITREIGELEGEAMSLGNLGNAYRHLGQYQKAIEYHERALALARQMGDPQSEGTALGNLGNVYQGLGQYERAADYHEQALAIARRIGHRQGEAERLNNLGLVYRSLGQYDTAIDTFEQALVIAREIGDRQAEGACLGSLGTAYKGLGQYRTAIEYHRQAISTGREIGDRSGEGIHLGNMGVAYDLLGQYERAVELYEQGLAIAREIGDPNMEAAAWNNLGIAYRNLGQVQKPIEYAEQALAITRETGDRQGEGVYLGTLGTAYHSLGELDRAVEYYEQALTIARDIGDRESESSHLTNLGVAYHDLEQVAQAITHYEQALAIARDIGDRHGEGAALNNLGTAQLELGEYETAIEYYAQAIHVLESVRAELAVGEFKSSFAAQNTFPYQDIITALIEQSRFEDAFHYAQRAKARAFLDQMGNARIDPRGANDAALVEEEETLRGEIQALDAQLRSEWDKPQDLRSEDALDSLQARLQERRGAYEDVLISLKLENPEHASLVAVETRTLTETQRLLTDTTLIEYYVSPNRTLAFVVGQGQFHAEVISVTSEALSLATSQFMTETKTTLRGVPTSLQVLYDALMAPIEPYLTSEQLFIAPHDILHYVPFAGLQDGERYLIEAHTLAQIPSASVLPLILDKVSREESGGPPLILGNPTGDLPSSGREAQSVAELYGTTAYVQGDAVEQLIWDQGPNVGVLHLAAHGIYNEQAPVFSRVQLNTTAGSEHDGLLEVHEVYNLSLSKADLVVLSGCQTNLGEHSKGDEVVGLTRAFMYAGAPSVISTLWSVEDAPSHDLMVALHSYLDQGLSKGAALRRAQMDLIHNPETAHPFYWAGFVLSGDAGSAVSTQRPGLSRFYPQTLSVAGLCRGCCLFVAVAILLSLAGVIWSWRKRGKGHRDD
jgi:tetratricopeptide (TPR) repeat protein